MSHLSGGHGGCYSFRLGDLQVLGAGNWGYYIDKFEHLHENKTGFQYPTAGQHTPTARRMGPARSPAKEEHYSSVRAVLRRELSFRECVWRGKTVPECQDSTAGHSPPSPRSNIPQVVMGEFEDTIARTVIAAFSALPPKSKPKERPDCTEWVPLAGIALETDGGEMICVALAWVSFFPLRDRRGGTKLIGLQDWDEVPTTRKDTSCCGDGAA